MENDYPASVDRSAAAVLTGRDSLVEELPRAHQGEESNGEFAPAATLQKRQNQSKQEAAARPTQIIHRYNRQLRSELRALSSVLRAMSCDLEICIPDLRAKREGPVFTRSECFLRMRYAQRVAVRFPSSGDQKLVQIVDAALADAARRSGEWLACRPGCTQCCIGVFAIHHLDVLRLHRGLEQLNKRDPERAAAVVQRARESWARLREEFPGNRKTGILDEDEAAAQKFEEFANEEACPVLDPVTGLCELYESRPMTCRVFGPPVRSEGGLGICELCFHGASEEEIASCEMVPDPDDLESRLLEKVEKRWKIRGNTIIAYALLD